MKVRAYGRLAELLGREREIGVEMPCTVAELRTRLAVECPEAAASLDNRRVLACVGDELVPGNYTVAAGETVEFFSPVSGG